MVILLRDVLDEMLEAYITLSIGARITMIVSRLIVANFAGTLLVVRLPSLCTKVLQNVSMADPVELIQVEVF